MDSTKRILAKMLTENTGRHMLDSGGAYGRNWERNQGRDFEAEPEGTLEFYARGAELDITATLNAYHWLSDRLEFDAKLDRRFHRWATRSSRADEPWLVSMEGFVEHLASRGHEIGGIYGDGEPFTVNTYNGEDMLSQTLQFVYFEMDNETYVLLQIHGGCDVRGGYTRARAFRMSSDEGTDILDNAKGTIYCTGEGAVNAIDPNQTEMPGMEHGEKYHYWWTDDTCHWYNEAQTGYGTQLEDYEATEDPNERGRGKVYVDDERNGYCPECGGKLALSSR